MSIECNTNNNNELSSVLDISYIFGLNSRINLSVQFHPILQETIVYVVGGIIITEDLNDKYNQVYFYHEKQISSFKVSNSGKYLAVGLINNVLEKDILASVIIWDYENKKIILELKGIKKGVKNLEFSPDDQFVSALGLDNSLFIWEIPKGLVVYNRFYDITVNMIKWVRMYFNDENNYPKYNIILSTINDIYDYNMKFQLKSMQYHIDYIKFAVPNSGLARTYVNSVYDYNTKLLIVGTLGGEIIVFDLVNHLFKFSLNCCNSSINNLLLNEDSSLIISGNDCKVKQLSLNNIYEKEYSYTLKYEFEFSAPISSTYYNIEKNELVSTSTDGKIYLINLLNKTSCTLRQFPIFPVNTIALSENYDSMYVGDDFGNIFKLDISNFNLINKIEGNGKVQITSITVSNTNVFTGDSDGYVNSFDSKLSNKIFNFSAHRGKVNCIIVNNSYIITGGEDGNVRLWTRNSLELALQFHAHHKEVRSIIVDNLYPNIIYTGGDDRNLNCFDLKLNKKVGVHYMKNGIIFGLDQSKDNNRDIISIGFNSGITIWDFFKNDPIEEITNIDTNFTSIKISDNNKLIALGSEFGEIWLFSYPNIKFVNKLKGHTRSVTSIQWIYNDKQILSSSLDSTICLWNIY